MAHALFIGVGTVDSKSGRKLRALVNLLDPVQVLQQLAAPTTQVFPPRPFHSSRPTFPTLV